MLFNSTDFLFFFIFVTTVYFLLPHKYRWLHLLIASCVFYMAFVPIYIVILFATIIIDYYAGIFIEKADGHNRKIWLIVSICANVGVLAVFKYYNFIAENLNTLLGLVLPSDNSASIPFLSILLPIGLSFHTFQAMSYTIEVYRGNQKAERHFGIYALYVMFYPQLVAGPIERPQQVMHQFYQKHKFNYFDVTEGLKLMAWGLLKKVVIADRLAIFTDPVFNQPQRYPALTIAIASIFFSYQIYCDFSGYSDMALGTARVMGFRLMRNFDHPYHAASIGEFWRRWHISLSTWFRDYLYIPLGGSRVSKSRRYLNLFIVFMVSGLWHGAAWTFIIWGALHGIYQVAGGLLKPVRSRLATLIGLSENSSVRRILGITTNFVLVTVAWIFFRAHSFADAIYMVKQLTKIPQELSNVIVKHTVTLGPSLPSIKLLPVFFALIIILEVIATLHMRFNLNKQLKAMPIYVRWGAYYLALLVIVMFGAFEERQFIYFQF
ncbi:MBOAT family O-acyltransferase [Hymenobacter guriensis]|uniref:MBOAT family protein n=1 Tax=Hymenobacter guriensis TaxID=2793065 RepID=A0ABS0L0Y1_9BACT|nr:MBOAT family O-acyltransferase [Hymenobacter guriensis]MBG8553728.1 MBOAT family protein [Hymenobacter guriensis]